MKKSFRCYQREMPNDILKAKGFINANKLEKIILIKGKKDFQMLKNNLEKNFEVKTKKVSQDVFQLIFT